MSHMPPPLAPAAFREACVEFLLHWEEVGEPGEAIDDQLAFEWFLDRFEGQNVDPAGTTLRFLETMDALEEPPLCEFVASADEGYEALHPAVFESAAQAPMSDEGKLDIAWIARDLGQRMREIETLERLLNEA